MSLVTGESVFYSRNNDNIQTTIDLKNKDFLKQAKMKIKKNILNKYNNFQLKVQSAVIKAQSEAILDSIKKELKSDVKKLKNEVKDFAKVGRSTGQIPRTYWTSALGEKVKELSAKVEAFHMVWLQEKKKDNPDVIKYKTELESISKKILYT